MKAKDCIVILDPGHGEDVAGKRSPDGKLREYKWARDTMAMLVDKFKAIGVQTYDTTQGSEYEPGLSVRTIRANTIAKTYKTKTCVFVSIHCNAAGHGKEWMNARGWCCFTTRGKTKSDKLADCIYAEAEKTFEGMKIRKDMSDGDADHEANFYVIKHTTMPAVLVENFFQDNKEDFEFLMSEEGHVKCADVMFNGVCKYLGL